MSYDRPLLFSIKISRTEPISFRYTVNSLRPMDKQQTLEKRAHFLMRF